MTCKQILLLFTAVVGVTILHVDEARAWIDFKTDELTMQPPDWCKDASAMVLDKYTNIGSGITAIRIKIFTEEGKEYGNVAVPASADDIHARTITPEGKTIEVKPSDIRKLQEAEQGELTNIPWHTKIAFPQVTAGSILEFYFVDRNTWLNSSRADFDYEDLPIRYSIVTYTACTSTDLDIVPVNLDRYEYDYEIKAESLPRCKGRRWNGMISRYQADDHEVFMPPADYYRPHVYFLFKGEKFLLSTEEGHTSWKKAVKDLREYTKEFMSGDHELRELGSRLVSGETDSVRIAHKLYDWVCDSLEYIDTRDWNQFGWDSEKDREISMSGRVKSRKATGAEKVLILDALCHLAHLDSRPVLVVSTNVRRAICNMPVLGQFSAFILALNLGGATTYLDPAIEHTAYGMLPWQYRNSMALTVADGVDTVTTIPLTRRPNLCQGEFHCKLDSLGNLTAKGTLTLMGEYRLLYYPEMLHADPQERKLIMAQLQFGIADTSQLKQIEVRLDSARGDVCYIDVDFAIPRYAGVLGDELLLKPNCVVRYPHDYFPQDAERRHDIYIPFASHRNVNLYYELPDGYEYAQAPVNVQQVGAEGLDYRASVNLDPASGMLVYQRSDARDNILYAASSYPALRDYFNALAQHDALEIVLRKKP